MRALLFSPALLAACLASPPESIGGDGGGGGGDGDGGGKDAAGDGDAVPAVCPQAVSLAFTQPSDLDGWATDSGLNCSHAITGEGLRFSNDGTASQCRAYRDRLVDLTGKRLRIRLIDHDSNLAMSVSLVIGSPEIPLNDRRWIYFERDQGLLMFGECSPELPGCSDTLWGSTTYDPEQHVWLGFSYQPGDDFLSLETSWDGEEYVAQTFPSGISATDVACAGVDLGSYELDTGDTGATSSFIDLATE